MKGAANYRLAGLMCAVVGAVLAGLLFAGGARAADLRVRHLGLAQGLAQSAGSAIAQDPDGLMWLGTFGGLQRYDGYSFVGYHRVPGEPASLSQDQVHDIAIASDGSVWVATDHGGLDRLKPDRSGFERFGHRSSDPASLSSNRLHALLLDSAGKLWIAGNEGVDRLLPDGHFHHYGIGNDQAPDKRTWALLQGHHGRIWVGAQAGLLYFDAQQDRLRPFQPTDDSKPAAAAALAAARVQCLMQGRGGRLWIGTTRGVFVLEADHRITAWLHHDASNPASLANDDVRALAQDVDGTVWVATFGGGLGRLDPSRRGWAFMDIRHDPGRTDSLSSNYVITLFVDYTGLVWIGTESGVDIYNPRSRAFGNLRQRRDDPTSLAGGLVWAIARETEGDLWVATMSGLTRFGKKPGDVGQYHLGSSRGGAYVLYRDSDDRLWAVATGRAGLYRNAGPGTPFRKLRQDSPAAARRAARISQFLLDQQGRLWAATYTGVLRLDPATGRELHWYPTAHGAGINRNPVASLCQGSDGALWAGTQHGVFRLDIQSGRFMAAPVRHGPASALAHMDVMACLALPDGSLWFGGPDALLRYQPATGHVRVFGVPDGLPSAAIYSLLRGPVGNIWAGTGRGLVRIDPASGKMHSFGRAAGLVNEEFNQSAALAHDTTLYFGGTHGVTIVEPSHLSVGIGAARVGITAYTVSGREDSQTHLRLPAAPPTFSYRQHTLSFDLAVFDYAAPDSNRFAYRLDGFDNAWHSLHDKHSITYTNLDAGDYTLRVKGIDSNGKPTTNQVELRFSIQPPPWLSVWALVLYVLVALLVLALGLYLFAIWVRRRNDLAKEQQRRQWAESLRDLIHVISPLTNQHQIATQLVDRLPQLIPHEQAAFLSIAGDDLQLVTARGYPDGEYPLLQKWIRHHREQIDSLCRQHRATSLEGGEALASELAPAFGYLLLPLNAADERCDFLLLARQRVHFRPAETELADVVARQVRVVLDNADLIERLARLARTDSLTGTRNRRWFMTQAAVEVKRCRRYQHPLALLLLDVDHFKGVNDRHGHQVGDEVLTILVQRCREQLREHDLLGRYGGEEFVVCLPETSADAALGIAERICRGIQLPPMPTAAGLVEVTVSIGVTSAVRSTDETLGALISAADKALYTAKKQGRNCVHASWQDADPA